MAIDGFCNITIDYLQSRLLADKDIRLGMLRLDAMHPVVSGNKWFKLKHNIDAAVDMHKTALLTFGGAFSNHLAATAFAARAAGLSSVGFVRGWHAAANQSSTLAACSDMGMQLHFMSREEYAGKTDAIFLKQLANQFPEAFLIPEGGNNVLGRRGAAEIATCVPEDATIVALPVGSGTTFAGMDDALPSEMALWGFAEFRNGAFVCREIAAGLSPVPRTREWITRFHFGGFAKHTPELIRFMNSFYEQHGIPLDFVYTAKMMYGLMILIEEGQIPPGSHVCALHTGGLQGNAAIASRLCF